MTILIPSAFIKDENDAVYLEAKINFSSLIMNYSRSIMDDILNIFNEDVVRDMGLSVLNNLERKDFARLFIGSNLEGINDYELKLIKEKLFEESIPTDIDGVSIDIYVTGDDGSGFIHLNDTRQNMVVSFSDDKTTSSLSVGDSRLVFTSLDGKHNLNIVGRLAEIKVMFANNIRLASELNLIVDKVYAGLLDGVVDDIFVNDKDSLEKILVESGISLDDKFYYYLINNIITSYDLSINLELLDEEYSHFIEELNEIYKASTKKVEPTANDEVPVTETPKEA